MALVTCNECEARVSERARTCVHCGNPLMEDGPGIIGYAVRILYALFCVALVVILFMAIVDPTLRPAEKVFVPVIGFGIWFVVSTSIAVLLYVTRLGRIRRIADAVRPN